MRLFIICFFSFLTFSSFAQKNKQMKPILGVLVDKSKQGETEFIQNQQECEKFFSKVNDDNDYNKLSESEKKIFDNCSESVESYWDILGIGCSWYCGGGLDTISASSELKNSKTINYLSKNIHDLSYETAWIEGVPGYGIGEFVTYHFPPENPRITDIIIVNGYVKSQQIWKDNSRVKKLKMYINNEPVAILNLVDSREEQTFKFDPIGYPDKQDLNKPWWTIKFEIVDVYKGNKYDDTAITEIYFDGIDVH